MDSWSAIRVDTKDSDLTNDTAFVCILWLTTNSFILKLNLMEVFQNSFLNFEKFPLDYWNNVDKL
jgi:hypothetical protein